MTFIKKIVNATLLQLPDIIGFNGGFESEGNMKFENKKTHEQYKVFVKENLTKLFSRNEIKSIVRFAPFIARFFQLNLDYLRELLIPTYNKPNNKPTDPTALFRSLLLMTMVKEKSITEWVVKLNDNKVYAILSGFDTDKLPGVGTFYDFINRITDNGDRRLRQQQRNRRKKFKRKPAKKLKKNEKLPPKHPNIVHKLVKRIIKNQDQQPYLGKYQILYQFFIYCVVKQSSQLGLLGELENLIVSGDGTHIKTGASSYGRKVCDCPKFVIKNGNKVFNRCDCKRKFSDYDAAWGWDSYREKYVYGYAFYEITAAASPFDLPLFFLQAQAQRHDSTLAPIGLDVTRKLLGLQYHIAKFLADSAHDNYPTYKLLNHFNCEAFIPLNDKNTGNYTYEPCPVNDLGIPVCKCGQQMIYSGYCSDRMRIKWRCPIKADKNFIAKKECQENDFCSPSKYGRVVYTYPEKNLRLFTKTPRASKQWFHIYDKRTSSERSFKRKKTDYRIEQAKVRSSEQWFVRFSLAAICQHLDAWAKTSTIDFKKLCRSWQHEIVNK
ncbi:MAG: hypothetical protein K8R68_11485 [Bacteroidales bacterium]|nr:hypothetical protein [Bacteroidales bacterium]